MPYKYSNNANLCVFNKLLLYHIKLVAYGVHNFLLKSDLHQLYMKPASLASSSCRATSTDIPDPLPPLFPIVHRLWQVFRATSCILT